MKHIDQLSPVAALALAASLIFHIGCNKVSPPSAPTPTTASSDKIITSFIIKAADNSSLLTTDVSATITSDSITLVFEQGTNIKNLVPTIGFTGKAITPASKTSQNFDSALNYVVTAQDSSTKTFHVAVSFISGNKSITGFTFRAADNSSNLSADVAGTIGTDTISVTVPNNTNLTAMVPNITISGKSISPGNLSPEDFRNPVKYTVTAVDGTTKTYLVIVKLAPAPSSGTIFAVAPTQGASNNTGSLYAFDAATGRVKWTYLDANPIWPAPTMAGGVLYDADFAGNILALDTATGNLRWSLPTSPNNRFQSNPTVVNGILYIGGADSFFYAINVNSEAINWKIKLPGKSSGSPTVNNGIVYFANADLLASSSIPKISKLYAVNGTTGAVIWAVNPSTDSGAVFPSNPAVVNGLVYYGCNDGFLYALNATTGNLAWKYHTGDVVTSSPTVANGILYVTGGNFSLNAFDAATGSLKWSHYNGFALPASPIVADGLVYFVSPDQYLYALDANTGNQIWTYQALTGLEQSPLYFNAAIFFSRANQMLSINSSTGKLNWAFSITNESFMFTGLCAVDTSGNVYHTADSGDQN